MIETCNGFAMEKPKFVEKKKRTSRKIIEDLKNLNINVDVDLSKRRYPKRNIKKINYYEEEFNDDHYIYCDFCLNEFINGCNEHPLIHVKDRPVPLRPRNAKRARLTIPSEMLKIAKSSIPNAGEGVWTVKKLQMGLCFGPYEGISTLIDKGGCYTWQIKKNGKLLKFIDGSKESHSNWMRFVNCPRNISEQNLMAFSYHGQMYYRTVKEIPKNTELFVYYGNSFAKQLGIDIKLFNLNSTTHDKNKKFANKKCKQNYNSKKRRRMNEVERLKF